MTVLAVIGGVALLVLGILVAAALWGLARLVEAAED
jgi:hypothetical protein